MDFKQKLKALYKKQNKIAPLIEGLESEIPQQTLDDYYVKLKTIIKEDDDKKQGNYETISGQKKEVEIEDIFNEPSIRRLLILGGAGVGKSTLMQYMAYRWSTNGLWKDKFDYVYRVTLKSLLTIGWDRDYTKDERQDELKCLIHYNLVAQGEEGVCKLKDMPWLEKKKKILLLLDGYDEVAHERNGLYKKLFEKIFEHENIILTSRPNAIDKQMSEKFGKKIENTGLDHQGIEKYLSQYFKNDQEKGEALREFLDKNSSIKEICHIPVNIAMMCFIWSEGDSNEALHEISNMSDLYKQVVDHLGFRYFAKTNAQQNQDEIMSKWRGGEIYLDELQVLEFTAYKGMTGGGIQVPNDKRLETLIIKGMTKKGDKDGISIQSSINYLRDQLKKDMPTINKVYKYGLLKPEGVGIDAAKKQNKKEPSETDLQEQSFSFIHLSFQEFLTALYLVQNLLKENHKEEQERIANFIAQHRNEPRYLMTLKLMAGILSAYDEDHKEAEQGLKLFWDAILCNPDGVLELGVEAKVTLLMHLLGQAKKDDIIDHRIPSGNLAVDFIDSVILQDLATWGFQLKESDYISPNIKEGLLQYFVKNNTQWISDKSSKLQERFTKQVKKTNSISLEAVMETISSIINKFSQDEQHQIFIKLVEFIKNHNEASWQLTKKAFETLLIIHQKSRLNVDDNSKKELFDAFLLTAYDSNLTEQSLKGMREILDITRNPSLLEKVKENLKLIQPNVKAEVAIKTKSHLFKIINPDLQSRKDFIHTSIAPFLQDPIRDIQALASHTITELAVSSNDKQLILDVLNLLLPLIKNSEAKNSISDNLQILVNKSGHQQPIQNQINNLLPSLKDPKEASLVISTASELGQLIKIKGNPIDSKLVSDIIKALIEVIYDSDWETKEKYFENVIEFVKITCQNNTQTAREVIKGVNELFHDLKNDRRAFAADANKEIIKLFDQNDIQFQKDIINDMIPLLHGSKKYTKVCVQGQIFDIVERTPEISKFVLETFTPLLQNADAEIGGIAADIIVDTPRMNPGLNKEVMNIMIPLSQHKEIGVRQIVLSHFQYLMTSCLRNELQLLTDITIGSLIPRLQDSDLTVKIYIVDCITQVCPVIYNHDNKFLREITNAMIPLIKDSDQQIKMQVSLGLELILTNSKSWDTQLLRDIIKALTPLLQDPDADMKMKVVHNIVNLLNLDEKSDVEFRREILNKLTPLLQDSDQDVKSTIIDIIRKIIRPELCKDAVNILTPLLQDPDPSIRSITLLNLQELSRIDNTLVRDVFTIISQALSDSAEQVTENASLYLIELVKIDKHNDPQLSRDALNLLAPFLQDSSDRVRDMAGTNLFALMKLNSANIQLGRDIIQLFTPIVQDELDWVRQAAAYRIYEITRMVHSNDVGFIKNVIEILTPLTKDESHYTRESVRAVLIRDLVAETDKNDPQLVQKAFDLVMSLLQDPDKGVQIRAPGKIKDFVQKIDVKLARNAVDALLPLLKDSDIEMRETATICIANTMPLNNDLKTDAVYLKDIIGFLTPLLKDADDYVRNAAIFAIAKVAAFTEDKQLAKEAIKIIIPIFKDPNPEVARPVGTCLIKICANRDVPFAKDILDNCLVIYLKDSDPAVKKLACAAVADIIRERDELKTPEVLGKTLLPLLKDSEKEVKDSALRNITFLLKNKDGSPNSNPVLFKKVIENYVPLLQDSESSISKSTKDKIIDILNMSDDAQLVKDTVDTLSPFFQHSNSDVSKNALEILKSVYPKLLLNPDIFAQYLTHTSKNLRDTVISFLLECLQKYLGNFQGFDQLFQRPLSDLTLDVIWKKLFKSDRNGGILEDKIQGYLDKLQEEELKAFLVSEINTINTLKGPGIIELSFAIIGQEKASSKDGSDREKLFELAKEVLNIQLKYLNEEGLIWINQNCEKLLSLSAEAKTFYKKIYHKLLEDEEVTSLEEQLLIKFINQGLTTSLTRDGEIIFEGKRYKLKGDNIEFALEKIAKTVIEQQQDILALQYKQHEPIFITSNPKGGMKQAAADIKEIRSIVDSRHALKIESWLLTKLKSLKFNSEIFLLEQRSAFGDHVLYHLTQQKLIRFYPNETPMLQDIFGSYIYGEAYQGEVTELVDKVGEKLLNEKEKISSKMQIEGQLKSKQIYFQQELLKQGNEDRNNAIEEELAKKLDNNRAVLAAKLKSLNLKETEKSIIEDYYEGFVSTFSSTYTSSQAIASGKLSVDDGEDFFSPVNLFIQLSSLAPFGIGEVLSGGLEAVRSHIKSTAIANEAKFVKDIAIDAVELSDFVSKTAFSIISSKQKRKEIMEAKDDEEPNNLVNRMKNLVMEKIEKLKNIAEKYTKMKNLFEKEVQTSPAFRLGESDANKIIKEWIDLKQAQPDLRLKPEEKQKKFTKTIIGELGEGNKITPMPGSPQEGKLPAKSSCCEIF